MNTRTVSVFWMFLGDCRKIAYPERPDCPSDHKTTAQNAVSRLFRDVQWRKPLIHLGL